MVLDHEATKAKIERLRELENAINTKRRQIRETISCLDDTVPDKITREGENITVNKYNRQTGADFTDDESETIHAIWDAKADALLA